jgi:hypothetical protein
VLSQSWVSHEPRLLPRKGFIINTCTNAKDTILKSRNNLHRYKDLSVHHSTIFKIIPRLFLHQFKDACTGAKTHVLEHFATRELFATIHSTFCTVSSIVFCINQICVFNI